MIHDILLVALWLAGAFGCLFMILAAALIFRLRGRRRRSMLRRRP